MKARSFHSISARASIFLSLALLVSFIQPALPAPALHLVLDINGRTNDASPFSLVSFKGKLVFVAKTAPGVTSLVQTDGTPGSTTVIKSFSMPYFINGPVFASADLIFFLVDNDEYTNYTDAGIWVSDGTEAGTYLVSTTIHYHYYERLAAVAGNKLFFYDYYDNYPSLWVTDGKSTESLAFSYPWYNLSYGTMGGEFYFAFNPWISVDNPHVYPYGIELWKSDGTPEGTVLVRDIWPGEGSSSPGLLAGGEGVLYFAANDGAHGTELWKTDGTSDGTQMVADLNPGSGSTTFANLTVANHILFFVADAGGGQAGLWRSDGSPDGTFLVEWFADLQSVQNLTPAGDGIFFSAPSEGAGNELWWSDGTTTGARMVKDISPGSASSCPAELAYLNRELYFSAEDGSHGRELWVSDGSQGGTRLVKDIYTGLSSSSPKWFVGLGDQVFFSAGEPEHGRELWKTDGTQEGTALVKDLYLQTAGSYPANFARFGSQLFFTADDALHGTELWKSDGTQTGTVLVKDLTPGSSGSQFMGLASSGELLFFAAGDISTGSGALWYSDGTPDGTALLRPILFPAWSGICSFWLAALGRTVYFLAYEETAGFELWFSDGTPGGTHLVKDIRPGEASSCPAPGAFFKGLFYFSADDGVHGAELWKSDGSEAGTVMVTNQGTSADHLNFNSPFAAAGDLLFFPTDTYNSMYDTWRSQLWVSDGSAAGTNVIKEIDTLGRFGAPVAGQDSGVLFSADDGIHGSELWKSDGTAAGTQLVKDILPGVEGSGPRYLTQVGDMIFFFALDTTASPPQSIALWKSDGTAEGTVLVKGNFPKDGFPGYENNEYPQPASAQGLLFFRTFNSFCSIVCSQTITLWKSDGTPDGTVPIMENTVGFDDSQLSNLLPAGGSLFFTKYEPETGWELWGASVLPPRLVLPAVLRQ